MPSLPMLHLTAFALACFISEMTQPLVTRQPRRAYSFCCYGTFRVSQHSTRWKPLLGFRLSYVGQAVKSVFSLMPGRCFVQLCHRRHAQRMGHSMHMLCMLCSWGVYMHDDVNHHACNMAAEHWQHLSSWAQRLLHHSCYILQTIHTLCDT